MLELSPNYIDGLNSTQKKQTKSDVDMDLIPYTKSTKKRMISSLAYYLDNVVLDSNKKQTSLATRRQWRNNDNFGLFPVNNPPIFNKMKPPIGIESISSNNGLTEINGILEISDIMSKTLEVEENSILNVENSLDVENDYSDIMLDYDFKKKQNEIKNLK